MGKTEVEFKGQIKIPQECVAAGIITPSSSQCGREQGAKSSDETSPHLSAMWERLISFHACPLAT